MPAYQAEWAAFVEAATSGARVPVSLEDGVAALAMAEAATLSAQSGRPVHLAEVLKPVAK
jgi:myo-inositol 2-dehydrogenase/D-chiro-inositol 1-dehydrogenase